jgi:hypothetical protein
MQVRKFRLDVAQRLEVPDSLRSDVDDQVRGKLRSHRRGRALGKRSAKHFYNEAVKDRKQPRPLQMEHLGGDRDAATLANHCRECREDAVFGPAIRPQRLFGLKQVDPRIDLLQPRKGCVCD